MSQWVSQGKANIFSFKA